MDKAVTSPGLVRLGTFEVDLRAGELRKAGVKLKLTGQPFQVLAILLENPGQVVAREELQKRLWRDTFVDFDHNLNAAINKIREVLGDSAESPVLSRLCLGVAIDLLRRLRSLRLGSHSTAERCGGHRECLGFAAFRSCPSSSCSLVGPPLSSTNDCKPLLHRANERSHASPLMTVYRLGQRGHRTAASSLTVPTGGQIRHPGTASKRGRRSANNQGPGSQLAAGLVP